MEPKGANRAKQGHTRANGSKWSQTGPNGVKSDQMGLTRAIPGEKGPKGSKWGQTGPKGPHGAKQDQIRQNRAK